MIAFLTWIILAVALGYFANEAEGVVLVGVSLLHFLVRFYVLLSF